jgi:anaerobic selenocysteine-containing dehydrogenase
MPPVEEPDAQYSFWLTTGRLVFHWHTRSKTGRVPALRQAAPTPFVQISDEDAGRLKICTGDRLRIGSRRGAVEVEARVGDIVPGHLFLPFHYGDWDSREGHRAANELTITDWDAVSKQPNFKFAAVWIQKV